VPVLIKKFLLHLFIINVIKNCNFYGRNISRITGQNYFSVGSSYEKDRWAVRVWLDLDNFASVSTSKNSLWPG
jgi:hypothetical protein